MATTRSTSRSRTSAKRSTGSRTRSRAHSASKRKTSTRSRSSSTAHRRSSSTAHKTGHKSSHGQAHHRSQSEKRSSNPSSTGHGRAKKEPAKQTSRCWPGYEPVAGKARNEKGSCKPKAHQTASEKKSDSMAAAASKLRKAGSSKARANRPH